MKLSKEQIANLSAQNTSSLKFRVRDILIASEKPLTKTEIAQLCKVEGTRPEHNISSQLTYLRSEGYVVNAVETNPNRYLVLALPTGDVPANAEPFVKKMLK